MMSKKDFVGLALLEAAKAQEAASMADSMVPQLRAGATPIEKAEYCRLGQIADDMRERACELRRAAIAKAEGRK